MRKTVLLFLLFFPVHCWALYECPERGRIVLSSAPCDTTYTSLSKYQPEPVTRAGAPVADSVLLRLNKGGSYVMQGTVQGVPVQYVVDTGASVTAISSRVAVAAGISKCVGFGNTDTANGELKTCRAVASSIVFGSFYMTDVTVVIMPNMQTDALLGMDVLGKLKLHQFDGVLQLSR